MSSLKSSVAKAVAAAIMLSAGATAFAATAPSSGPTDLFVAVWNTATNKSVVQDLGSSFSLANLDSTSTFNSASGYSTTASLDGGNLTTDLGAGTYSYALFAGDLSVAGASFNAYTGNSMYLSQTSSLGKTLESNISIFGNAGPTLDTYVVNNLPGANTTFLTGDDHSAGSKYWAATTNVNAPGSNFTIGGFQGAAVGSGTLSLLKYLGVTENGPDLITPTFLGNSAHNGVFSLSTTGTLAYNLAAATTTVPLPAAGWLLVSGLLGLGTVGRRKAVAAA